MPTLYDQYDVPLGVHPDVEEAPLEGEQAYFPIDASPSTLAWAAAPFLAVRTGGLGTARLDEGPHSEVCPRT
ncbi:MAG: hypothetical protein QXZ28_01510 [Candidatus Methanomethylicaceae archaeon]